MRRRVVVWGPMIQSTISIWVALIAATALAATWLQSRFSLDRRKQALASLADRWKLMPNGDSLPLGMTLQNTELRGWMKVRNSYTGMINGREVAFFDLSLDIGQARWSRTVIARRGEDVLGAAPLGQPELMEQSAGEWRILFEPRHLLNVNRPFMPVERVEAALQQLATAIT